MISEKKKGSSKFLWPAVVFITAAVLLFAARLDEHNRIKKVENNAAAWKQQTVTFPKAGSLQPAGYITITWSAADTMGQVKGYKVYVDDKLIAETDAQTTTCEYYTTEVSAHQVYIEADLRHGATIYSDIETFYVNKKGFCVNKDMAQNIEAPEWGVSWYYNWAMESLRYDSFQELQYVPMMWGRSDTDDKVINRFPKWGYKYVLAYNEPDRSDQANMDVEDAVEGMKDFMNKGLYVGSPATSLCPPWSKNWFQPFMERMEYEGMDLDFIAVHHYWNWYQDEGAEAFLELIDQTWEMYHKPIWITEFAISGDPGKNEEQLKAVEGYMEKVLPGLDEREYVERYAWFSFDTISYRNGGSALLNWYTGEMRHLGEIYQEMGMPEGYKDADVELTMANPKVDTIK